MEDQVEADLMAWKASQSEKRKKHKADRAEWSSQMAAFDEKVGLTAGRISSGGANMYGAGVLPGCIDEPTTLAAEAPRTDEAPGQTRRSLLCGRAQCGCTVA